MFIRDHMTANPFTVTPDDTVPKAVEVMKLNHVRHLPVLRDGKVVGVIANSDIAKASPSQATSFSIGEITYLFSKLKVGKVMSRDVYTIAADAFLEQAAVLMRDHKIEMVPVMEGDKLVGVITESDILDSFVDIMGMRMRGTRLVLEATDAPGQLSRITGLVADHGMNITHLAVYPGSGTSQIVLGVNSLNTADLETQLVGLGYRVIARLRNEPGKD
ncbi:CBS domain protein/ACT domain-containing protein [Propionibacterium freudenreichii]|uniref:CBS and ACT domain-containing protein n=1 Tax=Propionibacterium freudenreichii TaxID=1744 RepID=UPI000BC2DDC5|nr:CBS and ACT domain-containing protein [Propionibacterium freudenreichii]SBN60083.1 CBS domain protein/ACT domain-containing protein [Propionibacterium freudenreichii]SCQ48530.1 CBS domain protein/ACT domain-containing protein [Propionibacterium freudenreichii]SCQ53601.1 CBS domain protein/ACT domain-containing protein [Propionibacterium freudenreichii]